MSRSDEMAASRRVWPIDAYCLTNLGMRPRVNPAQSLHTRSCPSHSGPAPTEIVKDISENFLPDLLASGAGRLVFVPEDELEQELESFLAAHRGYEIPPHVLAAVQRTPDEIAEDDEVEVEFDNVLVRVP